MRKYIILLLTLVTFVAKSQKPEIFNKDAINTFKEITGQATYILQQDYYLIDTTNNSNNKIGLNNKKYFGRFYFVALLADGDFYTDSNINNPWLLDTNYSELMDTEKYIPQLGTLCYKKIDDKDFKQIDSINEYNKSRISKLDTTIRYAILKAPEAISGLKIASNNEKLTDSTSYHWYISVKEAKNYTEKLVIESLPTLSFDLSKGKFSLTKNSYIKNDFFYEENTIGGFIFTTKASLGKVEYFLSGIISRNKQGKFDMIAFKSKENKKKESKKETKINQENKKSETDTPAKITEIKD